MQSDEEEIRQLVSSWMAASKAGDIETVLSLMADDVVFLVPGQPVCTKLTSPLRHVLNQVRRLHNSRVGARFKRLEFSETVSLCGRSSPSS